MPRRGARIRVILTASQTSSSQRLASALLLGGFEISALVNTGQDAVDAALTHRPDVAVLDVDMPEGGTWAATEISLRLPQTHIVMLAASLDDERLLEALRAGVSGCLSRDGDPEELPAVVRAVVSGDAAIPPRLTARVLDELRREGRAAGRERRPVDRLSARERQVMTLLSAGRTTEQVAAALYVSTTTVRVHVSGALRKLRVSDRESAFNIIRGAEPGPGQLSEPG